MKSPKPPKPQDPFAGKIPTRPSQRRPQRAARTFQFRTDQPSVANYIARVVILCHMDFERAVELIEPSLTDEAIKTVGARIEASASVRNAIEKQLSAKGLDNNAKEIFVEEIWNRFWNGGKDEKKDATRVLAKAFIAEKVEVEKPEELPIRGFNEGVAMMLGKGVPPDDSDQTDSLDSALD